MTKPMHQQPIRKKEEREPAPISSLVCPNTKKRMTLFFCRGTDSSLPRRSKFLFLAPKKTAPKTPEMSRPGDPPDPKLKQPPNTTRRREIKQQRRLRAGAGQRQTCTCRCRGCWRSASGRGSTHRGSARTAALRPPPPPWLPPCTRSRPPRRS